MVGLAIMVTLHYTGHLSVSAGVCWGPLKLSKMAHLKNVGTQNNNLSESDIHYIRKMQGCQTDIPTINYVYKTLRHNFYIYANPVIRVILGLG